MRQRVERNGNVALVFDGQLIADVSSRRTEAQQQWMEIRIYRTDTGKWVTEMVGRSIIEGQRDRINVHVHETIDTIPEGLMRKVATPYLTNLAVAALNDAAEHDHELRPLLAQHV